MSVRMARAVMHPAVTILGHCTGRKLSSDGVQPASDAALKRAPSDFDAELVFTACQQSGTAVEINCRPERQDPPDELLRLALDIGCDVAIDTDAHAPGQLDWLPLGASRAAQAGVEADSIITTWPLERLLAWTGGRG